MEETEDKCVCGQLLYWMSTWNERGGPLVCDNTGCYKYRAPEL